MHYRINHAKTIYDHDGQRSSETKRRDLYGYVPPCLHFRLIYSFVANSAFASAFTIIYNLTYPRSKSSASRWKQARHQTSPAVRLRGRNTGAREPTDGWGPRERCSAKRIVREWSAVLRDLSVLPPNNTTAGVKKKPGQLRKRTRRLTEESGNKVEDGGVLHAQRVHGNAVRPEVEPARTRQDAQVQAQTFRLF